MIYVCDICPLTAYKKKTGNDSTNSEHYCLVSNSPLYAVLGLVSVTAGLVFCKTGLNGERFVASLIFLNVLIEVKELG